MRYCHDRKLAFFFPSRTGGVTLNNYFNYWSVPEVRPTGHEPNFNELSIEMRHMFPSEGEKHVPEVKNYKRYMFFRDPLARFGSICMKYKSTNFEITISKIIKNFDQYKDKILFAPQIKYYDNVEVFDFNNYETEVRKIGAMFGKTDFTIYKYNSYPYKNSEITAQVKDFVRSYYADDYKLGKELFKREY